MYVPFYLFVLVHSYVYMYIYFYLDVEVMAIKRLSKFSTSLKLQTQHQVCPYPGHPIWGYTERTLSITGQMEAVTVIFLLLFKSFTRSVGKLCETVFFFLQWRWL